MDSAVKVSLLASLIACASAQWPCPMEGLFCDPESVQYDTWPTTGLTMDAVAMECYTECNVPTTSVGTCAAFTVIKTGNRPPKCLLLKEPCVENILDDCIALGNCVSGPNDCSLAKWEADCSFVDSFCDIVGPRDEHQLTANNGPDNTAGAAAEECYNACNRDTATCKAFTVRKIGNRPSKCFLFKEDCVYNTVDDCIALGNCVSGPNDCSVAPPTCPVVAALDEGFVPWQCVDINFEPINPYLQEPPAGTACFQTCPSWESVDGSVARLKSVCQENSTWSEAQNYDGGEMAFPLYPDGAMSYPTPDTTDETVALTCGCPPLEVKWPYEEAGAWYDPNTEEAAEFICETPVVQGDLGEYRIDTENTCMLYCDDHYVATAKCVNGAWTGNPEWGFWCYEEPSTTV